MTSQTTIQEIIKLTSRIQKEFPELYKRLPEIPETIPTEVNEDHPTQVDYSAYLETLRGQLASFRASHSAG